MTSRDFTVGVTGHRPNRLGISEAALTRQCADVLAALAAGAGARRRVAISALAEGADRAFAEAALTCDYELVALLPFASSDYETTFGDAATTSAYRHLLARSARIVELPGSLAATKDAYAAMGAETVRLSDIIVAVWDGKPAAGKGGTPDIIEMALAAAKPVIWIDAAGASPPRRLMPKPGAETSLEAAIARATALDAALLSRLASDHDHAD